MRAMSQNVPDDESFELLSELVAEIPGWVGLDPAEVEQGAARGIFISTDTLQAYKYAAEQMDVSFDTFISYSFSESTNSGQLVPSRHRLLASRTGLV